MIDGPSASDAQGLPGRLSCISLGWAGPTRLGHLVRRGGRGGEMGQLFCDERPSDSEQVSFFWQKRPPSQLKNTETTYILRHDAIPIPPTKRASSLEQIFQQIPLSLSLSLAQPLMCSLWKRFRHEPQSHYRKKRPFPRRRIIVVPGAERKGK